MIPGPFDYHRAETVEEALGLLARHDEAKALAGGQSLIPAMRLRLALPEVLVDLNGIGELAGLEETDGVLSIGAMTRESELEGFPSLRERYPLLADATAVIADPLVRNRATVGGNLAHADPANDHPAAMLAYGAELVARSASGSRTIPIDEFFVDLFSSALEPGELLTEIRVPQPGPGSGGAYSKVERKVGDYAVAGVAVQLTLDGDEVVQARIALTNLNPTPMRATDAEAAVVGRRLDPERDGETLEAAGKAAAAECDPSPDLRGSVEYKRDLVRVLTRRTLVRAARRAKGGNA